MLTAVLLVDYVNTIYADVKVKFYNLFGAYKAVWTTRKHNCLVNNHN